MVNLIRDSIIIKPENKTILYSRLGYEYDPKSGMRETIDQIKPVNHQGLESGTMIGFKNITN